MSTTGIEKYMTVSWKDHVVSTPDVLRGKPRIKGTRIPVSLVLGYLASGFSHEEITREFHDSQVNRSWHALIMPVNWRNSRWPSNGTEVLCRPVNQTKREHQQGRTNNDSAGQKRRQL